MLTVDTVARRRFHPRAVVALLVTAVFLIAVGVLTQGVMIRSYERLEQDAIAQSTEQVVKALHAEQRQMAVMATDYASWDEMYEFVRSRDPKFAELNFSRLGLRDMEINLVLVIDETGREVYSAEQHAAGDRYRVPASPALRRVVEQTLGDIVRRSAGEDGLALVSLPDGTALAVSRPIIRTDRTGPVRGQLVMLRLITGPSIARMQAVTQLPVESREFETALADAQLPSPVLGWLREPRAQTLRFTLPTGADRITGHALLQDVQGRPRLLLSTYTPRGIYQQGRHTFQMVFVSIALLTLLAIALVTIVQRRADRADSMARRNETLYRAVVEQADEGIALFDPATQRILECNPALARLTGHELQRLREMGVEELIEPSGLPMFWHLLSMAAGADREPAEITIRRADGTTLELEAAASLVQLEERQLYSLRVRDVSQRKQAEARLLDQQRRLEYLANHDALTGLPNRLQLGLALPELIETAQRERALLGVIYIDVDNFKNINDSSGHDIGDEYLRRIAERLRPLVAARDLVARISGDEFVIAALAKDPRAFDLIATRVIEAMRQPFVIGDRDYSGSVSAGIAIHPRDGATAADLLRSADIALYQAKERGRNNFQFFQNEMNARVHEKMQLLRALRAALAERQLSVHYQPIIDLRTNRIAALEALARWQHPTLGDISPGQFIPVAEEFGLIIELGEQLLDQVCAQLATWSARGLSVVPVSVNVSAQQLQRQQIKDLVLACCERHGIPARLIHIELTETAVMREIERQASDIEALRRAGVRVSIDDFGTGYSSLSYLKHLPIDYLKIDRSFVRDMAVDSNDAAIVSAIIRMAQSLKLETIAEGVESAQHATRLKALGCDQAQGYFYSAALPAENCEILLRQLGERAGLQSAAVDNGGRRSA